MRPSLAYTPMVAIWELTRACDLACRHCRASAMPARDVRELSTEESFRLLDGFRDLAPGVLVLTGGDPLKRPDLFSIVEGAVQRGLTVAIAPSVTLLLTDVAIARLARLGVHRIALSLDGADAATHDGLRGVAGSFERTLHAIEAVRAAGVPLQLNTSLTPASVPRLADTGRLVVRIAPALWSVFFVVPVGRATAAQQLDAATCEDVFHWLCDWSEATGVAVKTTAAPAYRRVVLQREAARARAGERRRPHPPAVNDGKGFLFVSHTGEVYPSGFLPLAVGNVRDTPVAELYRLHSHFRDLRDDRRLEGKCGRCSFRNVCGGSRARAFATTGNPFAEDPACIYEPPP
jgi:radical SAM protein